METQREAGRTAKAKGLALAGALTLGLVGGAAAVTVMGAAAATPSPSSSASSGPSSTGPSSAEGGNTSWSPVRGDEKAVSGDKAATLRAAALKAVPGGTVYRIETDAGDGVYEAHMTKSDGTRVTVKFDSNLKVTKVEDGMGAGDPGGGRHGGPGGSGRGGPGIGEGGAAA